MEEKLRFALQELVEEAIRVANLFIASPEDYKRLEEMQEKILQTVYPKK